MPGQDSAPRYSATASSAPSSTPATAARSDTCPEGVSTVENMLLSWRSRGTARETALLWGSGVSPGGLPPPGSGGSSAHGHKVGGWLSMHAWLAAHTKAVAA